MIQTRLIPLALLFSHTFPNKIQPTRTPGAAPLTVLRVKISAPLTTSTIQFSMVTCSWRHTQTTTWVRVFLEWINAHFQAPAYHRNAQTHFQYCTFVQIILKNSIFQSHKRFTTFKIFRRHAKQKQKRETNKIHTNKLDDEFVLKFGAALTYAKTRWYKTHIWKTKERTNEALQKTSYFLTLLTGKNFSTGYIRRAKQIEHGSCVSVVLSTFSPHNRTKNC